MVDKCSFDWYSENKVTSVAYQRGETMSREEKGISAAELEIMRALWSAGRAMNMGEIREALAYTGWDPSTIKTLVTRLVKKGELVQTRIKVYYYEPTVTREEYGSAAAKKLAEKVYGGGLAKLFVSFVEGGEFSQSEIEELREILERAKGD